MKYIQCPQCGSTNCQKISIILKTDSVEILEQATNYGIIVSNSMALSAGVTKNKGKSSSLLVKELPKAPFVFNPGQAFIAYAIAFGILEFIGWQVINNVFELELSFDSIFNLIIYLTVINTILSAITCYFLRDSIRRVCEQSQANYEKWERLCICKACDYRWEANF